MNINKNNNDDNNTREPAVNLTQQNNLSTITRVSSAEMRIRRDNSKAKINGVTRTRCNRPINFAHSCYQLTPLPWHAVSPMHVNSLNLLTTADHPPLELTKQQLPKTNRNQL